MRGVKLANHWKFPGAQDVSTFAVTLSRANYCVPTEIALWLLCQPKKHTYTHTHTHTNTHFHSSCKVTRTKNTRSNFVLFVFKWFISRRPLQLFLPPTAPDNHPGSKTQAHTHRLTHTQKHHHYLILWNRHEIESSHFSIWPLAESVYLCQCLPHTRTFPAQEAPHIW